MMIVYNEEKKVNYRDLINLFNQAGWEDKIKDIKRLKDMVKYSQVVITAWDKEHMVGFARCNTDYVFNGQINNVVVDKEYRHMGIGKKLVNKIIRSNNKVTYILRGDNNNKDFYNNLGFKLNELTYVFKREI
ncbi:MAG: GNAT family N-acetyltransferase [Firmicutes bacterium]|nr:GNAT family N-acetyltransferase [Bacillota bacterium]